ncbi:MAG: hypothetical protein M0R74_18215 [Dehalococcoidia bacterium]|nr:hypothetical protein [Dehalococcoidia bacterium]
MAELKDTAEQFAKDLMNQNVAGLMMAFTPEGMGKAMALQAQQQAAGPQPPATGVEVEVLGQEGDDHVVDIIMKNAEGQGVIATRWRDIAGAWKVNDMVLKQ